MVEKIYIKFTAIKQRCNNIKNPKYKYYWWRWIKCERKSFDEFKNDMYSTYIEHVSLWWEKNTTIDRIDNNWNYCKENCRWATKKVQNNNTRNNVYIEYLWRNLNIRQRAKEIWIDENVLRCRIKRRWRDIQKCLEKPIIYEKKFVYNWKYKNISERAKEIWISKSSLSRRIQRFWNIKNAIEKEYRKWYNF